LRRRLLRLLPLNSLRALVLARHHRAHKRLALVRWFRWALACSVASLAVLLALAWLLAQTSSLACCLRRNLPLLLRASNRLWAVNRARLLLAVPLLVRRLARLRALLLRA
jgi:hypothetical protein